MKHLYPGCRVKIVANVGQPSTDWTVGMEGTIAAVELDCSMWMEGHHIELAEPCFSHLRFHPDDLEPILPEGLESEGEIAALYAPDSVTA